MDTYNCILGDLQLITPINPSITPPFYREDDSPVNQIKALTRQMRRAKSQRNRVETLLTAFYIGEILEIKVETPAERSRCLSQLTAHYSKAAVWIYYLFEFLGVEQIARTRYLTLTMLTKLGLSKYQQLKNEAAAIAGARLQEEEVVDM